MTDERFQGRDETRGSEAAEDTRFVAFLRRAAASYHVPPETPADAMWTVIEARWRPELGAAAYHRPPETPKEEMWTRIEAAWRLRATAPPEAREAGWEALPVDEPAALDGEEAGEARSADPATAAEPSAARRDRRRRAAWAWPVGIAAALALGILIGRETIPAPGGGLGPVASDVPDVTREPVVTMDVGAMDAEAEARLETSGEEGEGSIETPSRVRREPESRGAGSGEGPSERRGIEAGTRLATERHLARVETFLTAFRGGEASEGDDASTSRWAEELLAQTRLLLDWSDGDPRLTTLLEELELVLVQIVRLDGGPGEREWVVDAMDRQNVLPRLRSAAPAGPAPPTAGT